MQHALVMTLNLFSPNQAQAAEVQEEPDQESLPYQGSKGFNLNLSYRPSSLSLSRMTHLKHRAFYFCCFRPTITGKGVPDIFCEASGVVGRSIPVNNNLSYRPLSRYLLSSMIHLKHPAFNLVLCIAKYWWRADQVKA